MTKKPLDPRYKTLVPNGLLGRAHELGMAIYFYMWCVARTTAEVIHSDEEDEQRRQGSVLGGSPVSIADLSRDFPGIGRDAFHEWRKKCEAAGLVRTKRTPIGYVVEVNNSVKFHSKPAKHLGPWRRNAKSDSGKTRNHPTEVIQGKPVITEQVIRENPESDSGKSVITGAVIRENPESNIKEKGFKEEKEKRETAPPFSRSFSSEEETSTEVEKIDLAGNNRPAESNPDKLVEIISRELLSRSSILYGGHRKSLRQQLASGGWTEEQVAAAVCDLLDGLDDFEMKHASGILATNLVAKLGLARERAATATAAGAEAEPEMSVEEQYAYIERMRAKGRAQVEKEDAERAAQSAALEEVTADPENFIGSVA